MTDITNDPQVASMQAAWQQGYDAAKNLRIGDIFKGAQPAAEAAGFTDKFHRSIFVTGYLHALDTVVGPILCDRETNAIVKLGK